MTLFGKGPWPLPKIPKNLLFLFALGALVFMLAFHQRLETVDETTEPSNHSTTSSSQHTVPIVASLKNQPTGSTTQQTQIEGAKLASNENWKNYINEKYGFKFQYPESAILYSPPGSTGSTLLSDTVIEFDSENVDSFYNAAVVAFSVYTKGAYQHAVQSNTNRCEIYRHYTRAYDGREADIVEQADCPANEGAGSGHTLEAVISLSDTEDLVFFANLGNPLIKENELAEKILSTLAFTN